MSVDAFLAHEDIDVSSQWRTEILRQLKSAMMARCSHLLIFFMAAILLPATAFAQSDKVASDFETYEKIGPIAYEMSLQFLDKNIAAIRTVAVLRYCSKDGLAKAVEGKEIDRSFKEKLGQLIKSRRFDGLPEYSILEAQAAANNFVIGYNFGFEAALKLAGGSQKGALCEVAITAANKILAE